MTPMRTDVFQLPPADDPNEPVPQAPQQNLMEGVARVLLDCAAFISQARTELKENSMKVSELTFKVDELISVATDLKNRETSVGSGVVSPSAPQEDDPEVQRLADRIDSAIKVLKGEDTSSSSQLPGVSPVDQPAPTPEADPNAPAQPQEPSPEALATSITGDPNAR